MRLTLRTMLAYMDEILEAGDQAEIGKKIEESEFASELVHRARDVMRRLRLDAPEPIGRGMGHDPNTVAEYLDNTMPTDQVADFEKVCLESDKSLAEVAACHQILTLVLGEPAEVPADSRQRMYAIPQLAERIEQQRLEQAHGEAAPAKSGADANTAAAAERAKRPKPVVPDYLRESRRSRGRKIAATLLAAAALGGLVVTAILRPDVFSLAKRNADDGAKVPAAPDVTPPTPTVTPPDAQPKPAVGAPAPGQTTKSATGTDQGPAAPSPADPGGVPDKTPLTPLPGNGEPTLQPPIVVPPGTDVPATGEGPELEEPPEPTPTGEPAIIPPGGPIGSYVSEKQVLLRTDLKTGQWQRLPTRAALSVGDRLLALPMFRPTIALSGGMTIQLVDGTDLALPEPMADGSPVVEMQFGRVVVMSIGQAGSRLHLRLADQPHDLEFGAANSVVAIQMRRMHVLGTNPEEVAAPATVDFYLASGDVTWRAGGQERKFQAPAHWQPGEAEKGSEAEGPEQPGVELPVWIDPATPSTVELSARMTVEGALAPDRSIVLSFSELVDRQAAGRRQEVRSLAARCAVYVGLFEPFVAALNDVQQKSRWAQHIDELRGALALGPDVAAKVREALVQKRGEEGKELYRMLWGYSDEDFVENGGNAQLVRYLNHDKLDFRVLAFWNLKTITGLGLRYRPENNKQRRRQSVAQWQKRLQSGEVVPAARRVAPRAAAGAPLPPAKPVPAPSDAPSGLNEFE